MHRSTTWPQVSRTRPILCWCRTPGRTNDRGFCRRFRHKILPLNAATPEKRSVDQRSKDVGRLRCQHPIQKTPFNALALKLRETTLHRDSGRDCILPIGRTRTNASKHPFALDKIVLLNDPRRIARDNRERRNAARDQGIRPYNGVASNHQFPFIADNHGSIANPAIFLDPNGSTRPLSPIDCETILLRFEARDPSLALTGRILHYSLHGCDFGPKSCTCAACRCPLPE